VIVALLSIVTGANSPVLRKKTTVVSKVTKDLEKLIADMLETVKAVQGMGIAAPQVNRSERICIAKIGEKFEALLNPEITWFGKKTDKLEEGCLSLPDVWVKVTRAAEIVVTFETPKGKKRELKLQGMDARVVQHEVDHLDGILIVDRAT